jgi:uncharacterized protein YkwD
MTTKVGIVGVFSICTVFATGLGTVAGFAVRADDLDTALYNGVNGLRQTCGAIRDDPRLAAAAQRHAGDIVRNGVGGGHIGSDGSSPYSRIADAGSTRARYTGEIIYWGTGSRATPSAALDGWMASPVHRAIILDCAFTAVGFAIAWDGNKMIAVGDFAAP